MFALLALIPGVGPFLSIGSLFAKYWKVFAIIGVAIAISVFVWKWDQHIATEATLAQQNAILAANVATLQKEAAMTAEANQVAGVRAAQAAVTTNQVTQITQEASHATSSQDAPIAPVLRSALDAIARLQQPASGH